MSRNFAEAIVLVALMVLPLLAFSPQPTRSTRPMVPTPPGPSTAALMKHTSCPFPTAQCLASINWSGYAITNKTNSVTFVGATWTVPAVDGASGTVSGTSTCPDTYPDTWLDASFWVGIDGFNNGYVEQTGTASDCQYGVVYYYPWYEFYPAISYPLPSSDVIVPGDTMYAYVNYTVSGKHKDMFGIWLQDETAPDVWSFSLYGKNKGAPRNSAEWITEAAAGCITQDCSYFNFLALTDFTSVTFTGATATVLCWTAKTCKVQPTYTLPVSSAAWGRSIYWIEVTTVFYPPPPPLPRAIPTAATDDGDFTVNWVSSGP